MIIIRNTSFTSQELNKISFLVWTFMRQFFDNLIMRKSLFPIWQNYGDVGYRSIPLLEMQWHRTLPFAGNLRRTMPPLLAARLLLHAPVCIPLYVKVRICNHGTVRIFQFSPLIFALEYIVINDNFDRCKHLNVCLIESK